MPKFGARLSALCITCALTAVVVCGASSTLVSAATDTTSTTVPDTTTSTTFPDTTTTSTTVVNVSALYPSSRLRFPPYSRVNPPALPKNSGSGRRVVYQNRLQWVWVVNAQDEVVRAMPVSGLRGVPEVGTYKVWSQSLRSFSLDFEGVWLNDMTRFAFGPHGGNIGFHAIPTKAGKPLQTVEQLGSFQGSGCVRMQPDDAKFIYRYAKPGTKVVVLP